MAGGCHVPSKTMLGFCCCACAEQGIAAAASNSPPANAPSFGHVRCRTIIFCLLLSISWARGLGAGRSGPLHGDLDAPVFHSVRPRVVRGIRMRVAEPLGRDDVRV